MTGHPRRPSHLRSSGLPPATNRSWVLGVVASTAALACGLYLATAARTISWAHGGADGPELAAAAYVLGVAHPTGYPLYSLLGHLFTYLPWGEVAFRVTLLSVVAATSAVAAITWLVARLAGPGDRSGLIGSAGGGLALATAPLFWSQANITEVYALHMALSAGALLLLAAWQPGKDRLLVGLALIIGLGFAHHVTMLFLAAVAGIYVLIRDPGVVRRPVAVVGAAGALILGLSFYLYLPIRAAADPLLNWGNPLDLQRTLDHITGRAYQGYVLSRPADAIFERIPALARVIGEQLTWPGLAISALGLIQLRRTIPRLGLAILAIGALNLTFALIYNAAGGQVYLLPCVLVLALGFGLGLAGLGRDLGIKAVLPVLVVVLGWQLISNWSSMDVRQDRQAWVYARETLDSVAPAGFVQTRLDEETFALWYVQFAEGHRMDVAVIDERLIYAPWFREQLQRRYPNQLAASGL